MRIAAIDIGTNSLHMIVVRVRPDLSFDVIDREKEMVRLGAGGLDGRDLTPTAMAAALQTLSKFRRLAESHAVDEIIAVATSATREAENGGDFIAEVRARTNIQIRVISGREEARLIHLAAAYGVDVGAGTAVVVDIGGGSVEVTLGSATQLALARSFKLGVIRLTERFVKTDPLAPRDERRLIRQIRLELGDHLDRIAARGFDRVIGTSGTILSLGAMAAAAEGQRVDDVRNRRVGARTMHRLRKQIVAADIQARLRMPGMEPRRADLSVAGAVLFDTILRRLAAAEFTLCDLALREGLILDFIHRNSARIRKAERYPDVRRRSIVELAERCGYWPEHAQQVARLALALFDQTRGVHGLSDREREWLEFGALLHDVGVHIGYERHHAHSYYLIKNGGLRGFEPQEVEIIALLARYHRRATPKRTHEGYGELPRAVRRTVKVLSAMVRVAEGLDRSHAQVVTGLEVVARRRDYLARVHASDDAELELWAAHRHVAPLQEMLDRPVRFELQSAHGASRAAAAGADGEVSPAMRREAHGANGRARRAARTTVAAAAASSRAADTAVRERRAARGRWRGVARRGRVEPGAA